MPTLFESVKLGTLELPNRAVMAPMTRARASAAGVPSPLAGTYYAQRAGAGLMITEGTQPSAAGQGYLNTPGLHTDKQVAGWRAVTDAVHAAGGTIFVQLLHTGRIGHPDINGLTPLAPSAVAADGQALTPDGTKDYVVPRPLTSDEIAATVRDFAGAAARAVHDAGFDGVELHGANGYLIHQFLASNTNLRTDSHGGSIAGRIRFAVEVVEATAEAVGAHRVGLRISPGNPYNDIAERDIMPLYAALVRALAPTGIAYLHLVATDAADVNDRIRDLWPERLIVNAHAGDRLADLAIAQRWLDRGADLIAFGRAFLANPDLVERLRADVGLNEPDPITFYGGDHRGYIDYPIRTGSAIQA